LLGAMLALFGCSTETRYDDHFVQGTALDHGRALFHDPGASPSTINAFACSTCHPGSTPVAGHIWPGATLAGATERASFWGGQENDLLRSINHCRFYFMAAQEPWTVEDEEAKAMYAFLVTWKGAADPVPFTVVRSVVDIPAGDANAGATTYANGCQTCHGALHTGDGRISAAAPILPDDTLVEHAQYSPTDQRVIIVEKILSEPPLVIGPGP